MKLSSLIHGTPGRPQLDPVPTSHVEEPPPVTASRPDPHQKLEDTIAKKRALELKLKMSKELESKENVDPMAMAPKKGTKQKYPLSNKSSSCRMGNTMVKRNSWNLAFEPLRPVFPQKTQPSARAADCSVYDFD